MTKLTTTTPEQTNSYARAENRIAPPGLAFRIIAAAMRIKLYERELADLVVSENDDANAPAAMGRDC